MPFDSRNKQLNGPYSHTQVQRERYPQWGTGDRGPKRQGYKCAICNNPQIRSLASVYGRGVHTSVSRRGRLIKRGYSTRTSKSVLAEKCAPPEKRGYGIGVLLLTAAALVWFAPLLFNMGLLQQYLAGAIDVSRIASVCLGWACLYALARAWLWNTNKFPALLDRWQRSYLCERCGTIMAI